LVEFSRIGQWFSLGRYLKITEVAQINEVLFATSQVTYVFILTKNGLGDFLRNSSAHPDADQHRN
jgi:hypothetical protein